MNMVPPKKKKEKKRESQGNMTKDSRGEKLTRMNFME